MPSIEKISDLKDLTTGVVITFARCSGGDDHDASKGLIISKANKALVEMFDDPLHVLPNGKVVRRLELDYKAALLRLHAAKDDYAACNILLKDGKVSQDVVDAANAALVQSEQEVANAKQEVDEAYAAVSNDYPRLDFPEYVAGTDAVIVADYLARKTKKAESAAEKSIVGIDRTQWRRPTIHYMLSSPLSAYQTGTSEFLTGSNPTNNMRDNGLVLFQQLKRDGDDVLATATCLVVRDGTNVVDMDLLKKCLKEFGHYFTSLPAGVADTVYVLPLDTDGDIVHDWDNIVDTIQSELQKSLTVLQ